MPGDSPGSTSAFLHLSPPHVTQLAASGLAARGVRVIHSFDQEFHLLSNGNAEKNTAGATHKDTFTYQMLLKLKTC